MPDYRSPQNVLNVFNRIEKELPTLVGSENWAKINDQYFDYTKKLRHSPQIDTEGITTIKLIRLFRPFAQARQKINTEIELQALISDTISEKLQPISIDLNIQEGESDPSLLALQYATHWSYNAQNIPSPQQIQEDRTRFSGTLKNAQPIKLNSVSFDMESLAQLSSGKTDISAGQIENPDPRLIAAGLITTITTWVSSQAVKFSEQDMTVLGGMIQLSSQSSVDERQLLETANTVCQNYGMPRLNEAQIRQSLMLLKENGFLRQKQSSISWQIISSYSKNVIVKIELPLSFNQFNIEQQSNFIDKLSNFTHIPPDDICILHIGSDKVVIAVEMPVVASEILTSQSQETQSQLNNLSISKVELIHQPKYEAFPDPTINNPLIDETKINLGKLREFTVNFFSESDLRDICFDEDIDFENLLGPRKSDRARDLVIHFKQRGRLADFVSICCKKRPKVPVIELISK